MSPGSDLSRIPPETLASSAMMPPHLRDDPVSTLIMVSTIQAYRLPVTFMNLGETYTVPQKDGNVRPGLMSKLQRTIAYRAGWEIEPVEITTEKAVVRIHRRDRPHDKGTLIAFTIADATRAGLVERNPTYKTYPDRMLFARACTKAIALVCPQVLFDPDLPEIADVDEWHAIEAATRDAEPVPVGVHDDQPEANADEVAYAPGEEPFDE